MNKQEKIKEIEKLKRYVATADSKRQKEVYLNRIWELKKEIKGDYIDDSIPDNGVEIDLSTRGQAYCGGSPMDCDPYDYR